MEKIDVITTENFESLSKEDKRMAILKDALRLIKAHLVVIDPVTVLQFGNYSEHEGVENGEEQDLQKVLKRRFAQKKTCRVCERGLLLVSTVLNDNRFKVEDVEIGGTFDPFSKTDKRLMEYFDGEQLALMEYALMTRIDGGRMGDFIMQHRDKTERAIAILENAIENNGIFIP